jgi:hypothetical protein
MARDRIVELVDAGGSVLPHGYGALQWKFPSVVVK